ncbi:hypothetical protein F2Q69_00022151 [Brassica cretica]|uniref:Uncharacterized protein n=1 Tax=Brassica cretica TaxID=69181 RepID=A0A8S9QLS2_BRACR|nr:hypothetical protein F2Q69_00022151 [Brassica cretica]
MTDGPTVYQGSGALHDGLTADPPRAPHVYLHVQVSCTETPHAFLDTHTPRSLPPRPEHTHI